MKKLENKQGFTLIELVVVMAIIAILAVLVIGAITIARRVMSDTTYTNDAKSVRDLLEAYRAKEGHYPCSSWNATSQTCTVNYSRINAYSFFDSSVQGNINYSGGSSCKANGEFKTDNLIGSTYPQGNPDRVCYTTAGNPAGADYYLWAVPENNTSYGCDCGRPGPGTGYSRPGSIQVHGPNGF